MVGRFRLLFRLFEHHRRRLRKRNMGAPLHSHFSNDTSRFQEDQLFFTNWAGLFFASFLSFFLSLFNFFLFGTRLLTLCNL